MVVVCGPSGSGKSTLIKTVKGLERTPQAIPPQRFLSILKELRDDLRLIIDSTTSEQYGEATLADLIASQRHRFTRLFETQGAQCTWQLSGLEQYALPARRRLDVMRILQEALSIVINRGDPGRHPVLRCARRRLAGLGCEPTV